MPAPSRDIAADLEVAITRRSAANVELLTAARAEVLGSYAAYREVVENVTGKCSIAAGNKDLSAALKGSYDLLDVGRPLWELRSHLFGLSSSSNYRCPFCVRAKVATLDHFLPKAKFPEYAVLAVNLVPVCERCNRLKGDECDTAGGILLFHAFLDSFPEVEILKADIAVGLGVSVRYRIEKPEFLSSVIYARIVKQFTVLDLLEYYKAEAIAEIADQVDTYAMVGEALGKEGLKSLLESLASAPGAVNVNHWKAVLFRALAQSDAFLEGGYKRLSAVS
ncbi:HNH endonuclease [Streptomyces sp. NPDC056480]|uniref:HNH endonuclease n=1 Tax=Streptomyces sp. NPDC056480 TaxID=3345833 RepID=UPI0036AADE26